MGRKSRQKIDRPASAPRAGFSSAEQGLVSQLVSSGNLAIVALLIVITFTVFGQVAAHKFLNYDDGQFISENTHVSKGLTPSSISWALTSTEIGWYPLTWLSHELDVSLWALNPAPHLLTNVGIHAVTACLLFFAVLLLQTWGFGTRPSGATRTPYAAAFVAALFAVHPMHVESVAWASERKDTLSTLFIVLALLLYVRAPQRRLGVALAMAASLAAKQMYVTFPFILLLLDYWPLARLRGLSDLKPRVVEKAPLFVLALAGSAIAVVGQTNLKAIQTTGSLSFAGRLANAAVAYCRYLGKLVVPVDLAIPYPLAPIAFAEIAGSVLLLVTLTALTVALRRRAPYLVVGWLWFIGTLVPVIGIVAIGTQAMADRYTYFSYVGLFLAIAAGAVALPVPSKALAIAGSLTILLCAGIAYHQVGYWRDSETIFTHAIAITPPNPVAEYSLGQTLELTKPDVSIAHLRSSIDLARQAAGSQGPFRDWYPQAHVGLGTALLMKARQEPSGPTRVSLIREALGALQAALKVDPSTPHARNNVAFAQAMLAQTATNSTTPADYAAAIERGVAKINHQDLDGAIAAFQQAVDLQPRSAAARVYLALAYLRVRRGREAAASLRTAKALDAKRSNDLITQTMHIPPGPENLDMIIAQAQAR
jgi:tetratricopeptide (TPR) repeat protein